MHRKEQNFKLITAGGLSDHYSEKINPFYIADFIICYSINYGKKYTQIFV